MFSTLVQLAVIAAAIGAIAATASPPAAALRQLEAPQLPTPGLVRVLMPGNTELAADFFWIRLTNATGAAVTAEEHRAIYDHAELITELAPRFLEVYQFAGGVIPYNRGRDTWVNGDESRKIIEKGLAQYPGDRALRLYLVFNLMYLDRDFKAAADLLTQLSKEPGAPAHYSALATRLYAQAGEFTSGLDLARALAESAPEGEQRAFFEHRARQIAAEQVLTEVDRAAWDFFRREGRQPTSTVELLAAGDLKAPPVDPLGGEIVLDAFGRARSTVEHFRLELYEDSTKTLAREPQP